MLWRKILTLDVKLTDSLRIHDGQKWMRRIGTFFAHSGDSWFIVLLLAFLWFFTSGEWRKLTSLLAIAVIVLALLVLSIKFLIRRQRPEGTWGAIYRNSDPHSFPSGHAARTMMLGTLMLLLGPSLDGSSLDCLGNPGQPGTRGYGSALLFRHICRYYPWRIVCVGLLRPDALDSHGNSANFPELTILDQPNPCQLFRQRVFLTREWMGPGGFLDLQNRRRVALRAAVGSTPMHSRLFIVS